MDSDSIYVTNQKDIVNCAKYCYNNYPTIVNNIPKEKNHYEYCIESYAAIDSNLAAAQRAIGESSNLAQIALTYTYNLKDKKYQDYVCILSVLAQVAIDSAKRRFDVDLSSEIRRIKKDMNVKLLGYPLFWKIVQSGFKSEINYNLKCPMNYLSQIKIKEYKPKDSTLPMDYFIKKIPISSNDRRRKSRQVEKLIDNYSLELFNFQDDNDDNFLLRYDFDNLIKDISRIYISRSYMELMSWLINRAFYTGKNQNQRLSIIEFNKSVLLKTLYRINQKLFLYIFNKNE